MSKLRLNTLDEQRELFLWKFRDVSRGDVQSMFEDFRRMDVDNKGELTEHQAMMLFERRGQALAATELRALVAEMDLDKNKCLSFVEWCCVSFGKSFEELNCFEDEESRQLALDKAKEFEVLALAAEAEIARAKAAEEEAARLRAEELERESKLTGVAGMKAFFFRKVEGAQDSTMTNMQKIQEEAARRKALRSAKQQLNAAMYEATKTLTAEEIEREVQKQAARQAADAAAQAARAALEERQARQARIAARNAQWGGGLPPPTPAALSSKK